MSHPHPLGNPAELAALYATGALPHDELAAFETHLAAGCEACQTELSQLHHVTALLLRSVRSAAPDPKTRQALLAQLAAKPGSAAASPLRERVLGEDTRGAPSNSLVIERASEASWESTAVKGVTIRTLFVDHASNHFTALVRMAPGTSYPRHIHSGPEECLVLEGDLRVNEEVIMHAGDYQRAPTGSCHGLQSTEQGCLLLITSSLTDQFV